MIRWITFPEDGLPYKKIADDLGVGMSTLNKSITAQRDTDGPYGRDKSPDWLQKRPGSSGGRLAVVADNTLNREFNVNAPDQFWGETLFAIGSKTMVERHHVYPHA
jgi:hypothetical protein